MEPSEQPQHRTVKASDGRGNAIRAAKWIVIVLIALFLVTRVIRFFLQ